MSTILKRLFDKKYKINSCWLFSGRLRVKRRPDLVFSCHRYSGKKLRETGKRFGVNESGVPQASRRIQLKQKNDKKFGKLITKTAKTLLLSNV